MPVRTSRSIPSLLRWVLPLAMLLACTEHAPAPSPGPGASPAAKEATPAVTAPAKAAVTPPSDPTKAAPAPAAVAAPAPAAAPAAVPPTPPVAAPPGLADAGGGEPGMPKVPTDAERIDAYVASCSHQFSVIPDEWDGEGNPQDAALDECEYYSWEQSCVADPGGCWDEGEACAKACGKPCTSCQAECAGGCDQCKAACAPGSTDCIRKCAEARLACRTQCMNAHSDCQSVDCPEREKKCNAAFDKKRKKACPQCAAISTCMGDDHGDEDHETACAREFPKAKKVCFEWCYEYYEDEDEAEP